MAAVVETTDSAEQHEVQYKRSETPTAEHGNEYFGGPLNRALSPAFAEPPADTAKFLSHPTLSQSANVSLRGIAFKRAQQTYGNHFAQSVVRGIQRKPGAASGIVQRDCACGG